MTKKSLSDFSFEDYQKIAKDFSLDNVDWSERQCGVPKIPIYPVRYGLTKDYIDKVKGGQASYQHPVIGNIPEPSGMSRTDVHQLQQIRQGFIYIYAHTQHRESSTDCKGKWMVFRYLTNHNDANGVFHSTKIEMKNYSGKPTFFLYNWKEEGAEGNWDRAELKGYDTVFVDPDVKFIDIAYSDYAWPPQLFDSLESDDKLRQKLMVSVNTDERDKITTYSAPLEKIDEFVLEYSSKENLLVLSEAWHTCVVNAEMPIKTLDGEKGLIVALRDTLGEIQELQQCHIILSERQKQYFAEYAYPLTIGDIIHPKLMHKLRGTTYEGKEKTLFEQDMYKKQLIVDFEDEYKKIAKKGIEDYEKPTKEIVAMIATLAKRPSFSGYIEALGKGVKQAKTDNGAILGSGCLLSTVGDVCYSLECSPEGEKVINSVLGATLQKKDNAFDLSEWGVFLSSMLDKVDSIVSLIHKDRRISSKLLAPFYWGMEKLFYTSGRALVKQWILDLDNTKVALSSEKLSRIYNLEGLDKTPDEFFSAMIEEILSETKAEMLRKRIDRRERRPYLRQLKKLLKPKIKAGKMKIQAAEKISQLKAQHFHGAVGVMGIFTGLLSLSSDDAIQRKLSHSGVEYLATNRVLLKTAAITDITLATWGVASGKAWAKSLGIPEMPDKIVPPKGAGKLSLRTVGANKVAFGVLGLNIIAGVAGMIIAYGGIEAAIRHDDKIALWSYRMIMISGAVTTFAPLVAKGIASILGVTLAINPLLTIAAIIAIIAGGVLFFFAKNELQSWLSTGFWGNSENYPFWKETVRPPLIKQIEAAKILANLEAKKQVKENEKLINNAIATGELLLHKNTEEVLWLKYQRISEGFAEELYEYGILGGLQVSQLSTGARFVTIRCAEFSKTPPNTTNLIVKYSVIREGKLITNKLTWKAQLISQSFVVIDLKEEKITDKAIRIDATFTDKEDEEFEGYSETVEYKNALTKIARERGSGYWPIYGLREVKK